MKFTKYCRIRWANYIRKIKYIFDKSYISPAFSFPPLSFYLNAFRIPKVTSFKGRGNLDIFFIFYIIFLDCFSQGQMKRQATFQPSTTGAICFLAIYSSLYSNRSPFYKHEIKKEVHEYHYELVYFFRRKKSAFGPCCTYIAACILIEAHFTSMKRKKEIDELYHKLIHFLRETILETNFEGRACKKKS